MTTTAPPPYAVELPDEDEIGRRLRDAEDMWMQRRNPFIYRMRAHLSGTNAVILPKAVGYTPIAVHTFSVLAIANRQLARFGFTPELDVLPVGHGEAAKNKAANIRAGTIAAFEQMDRKHLGVWRKAAFDAITLGMGVTEMLNCAMGDWPDLIPDKKVKGVLTSPMSRAYPDRDSFMKASAEYKRRAGLPIEERHVKLEDWYPVPENRRFTEAFKVETRSLRSILNNPLFDTSDLERQIQVAESTTHSEVSLSSRVTLLTYTNFGKYAYYAYTNLANGLSFPQVGGAYGQSWAQQYGTPVFLYETDHDLGRLPNAVIPGRFGPWLEPENEIEWVMEALLQQGQARDELWSQGATNVRVRHWPTTYTTLSKDRPRTKGTPEALQIDEGGNFYLYEGEEIHLLFEAHNDPMFTFMDAKLDESMQELGGSPAAFGSGDRPQGQSGYGENLIIAQAQDLENMVGEGLKEGMADRTVLLWSHVKALGEVVPVPWVEEAEDGTKNVNYIDLDPADFDEAFPMVEVDVTRPKQIDMVGAARVAMDLSNDRGGKGPFLSDETIMKDQLGVKDVRAENRRKLFERSMAMAQQSPAYMDGIMQKLALLRAQGATTVNQQMVNGADPTLLNTIQGMAASGETGVAGGVNPNLLNKVLGATQDQPPQVQPSGMGGGAVPGQAQPQQALGMAAANNVGPVQ